MGMGPFRGAAVAALCAAAALVCGCGGGGGGGGTEPANIAGQWSGALSLSFLPGGAVSGTLDLALAQEEAFAAGVAEWSPVDETLSVAAPIDGTSITLRLHFPCADVLTGNVRTETAVIAATVDGSTMTFTGASGLACLDGGVPREVSGGSGSVTRTTDDRPL